VLPALPSVFAACAAGVAFSYWLGLTSWWKLGLAGSVYAAIGLAVAWTVAIQPEDKDRALKTFRALGDRLQSQLGTT
jgi:heme O synthase-like polyprenyltransferase